MFRTIAIATVVFVAIAVVIASPSASQDRTSERLSDLETRVAVLETQVSSGPSTGEMTSTDTHTINGRLSLIGAPVSMGRSGIEGVIASDGEEECEGYGGFSDITAGASVTVTNESGTVLGVSHLGPGVPDPEFPTVSCLFEFTVETLPTAQFYGIEVSHRGIVTFALADLEANNWVAELVLTD